jgi:hypothetical protein
MTWYVWLILSLLAFSFLTYLLAKRARLMMKCKDEELIERLMKESFWVGQTKEQLIDSLGEPLDVIQKVLKTKVKEVWKYEQTGKNRYGLKITLDDGVVVGWHQK